MLGVSSIPCLQTNLLTVPTTQYTTNDKCKISLSKNMTTFSPMYFIWNTSVSGHKQGTVGFPQGKPLSRSNSNLAVSDITQVPICRRPTNQNGNSVGVQMLVQKQTGIVRYIRPRPRSFCRIHNLAHTFIQYSGAICFVPLEGSVNKLQDRSNFGRFSKLWLV